MDVCLAQGHIARPCLSHDEGGGVTGRGRSWGVALEGHFTRGYNWVASSAKVLPVVPCLGYTPAWKSVFLTLIPVGFHVTSYIIYSTCTFQSYHVSSSHVSPLGRQSGRVPSPIALWIQCLYSWKNLNPVLCNLQVTVYILLKIGHGVGRKWWETSNQVG